MGGDGGGETCQGFKQRSESMNTFELQLGAATRSSSPPIACSEKAIGSVPLVNRVSQYGENEQKMELPVEGRMSRTAGSMSSCQIKSCKEYKAQKVRVRRGTTDFWAA
jgi:hypothetical protein